LGQDFLACSKAWSFLKAPSFLTIKICFFSLFGLLACRKEATTITYNRTCISTQHHEQIIGNIDVYVKYDADDFNFPGWIDLAEYDTLFKTNAAGKGCIDNLPIGKHWVVGLGTDERINQQVKGRMFVNITFERPQIDTILYVGEE